MRVQALVLTMLMALAAKGGTVSSHGAVVAIESGKVQGITVASLPRGGAFLGIPYAAQPVGDLRWRAPQVAERWNGVRSAKAYGPACPQRPSPWLPEMLGRTEMATDEACLFLNVWTPELRRAGTLPVLVWIHGGGNVEGSAEWPPLGETLAREGVVVVSINTGSASLVSLRIRRCRRSRRSRYRGTMGNWTRLQRWSGCGGTLSGLAAIRIA